jgi:Ca-activated chloride channel family protein
LSEVSDCRAKCALGFGQFRLHGFATVTAEWQLAFAAYQFQRMAALVPGCLSQGWQAAVRGAVDLMDALRGRGGHRMALVVFAAKPKLVVPLTTDADHLTAKVLDLDAATPPPDIRPDEDSPSGTRIGAALAAAVDAHDPRFPGAQDIILISDGDDPANDREWAAGVSAARRAGIPVYVVGVGAPDRSSPVRVDGRPLLAPEPVETRLHEGVLRAIAAEGHGSYLPARQEVPRLAEFFRTTIEPASTRELADDALPSLRDRSAWFLGGGLLLLLVGWWRERGGK